MKNLIETLEKGRVVAIQIGIRIGFGSRTLSWNSLGITDSDLIKRYRKAGWKPPTIAIAKEWKDKLSYPKQWTVGSIACYTTSDAIEGSSSRTWYAPIDKLPEILKTYKQGEQKLEDAKSTILIEYQAYHEAWLHNQRLAIENSINAKNLTPLEKQDLNERAIEQIKRAFPTRDEINRVQLTLSHQEVKSLVELAREHQELKYAIAKTEREEALLETTRYTLEATQQSIEAAIENAKLGFEATILETLSELEKDASNANTNKERHRIEQALKQLSSSSSLIAYLDPNNFELSNLQNIQTEFNKLAGANNEDIYAKIEQIKQLIKVNRKDKIDTEKAGHRTVEMML